MNRVTKGLALVVGLALATAVGTQPAAADTTAPRFERAVEAVAPAYLTIPGRTLCVCQDGSHVTTQAGYLNSMTSRGDSGGDIRYDIMCVLPTFNEVDGTQFSVRNCFIFEVIK